MQRRGFVHVSSCPLLSYFDLNSCVSLSLMSIMIGSSCCSRSGPRLIATSLGLYSWHADVQSISAGLPLHSGAHSVLSITLLIRTCCVSVIPGRFVNVLLPCSCCFCRQPLMMMWPEEQMFLCLRSVYGLSLGAGWSIPSFETVQQ